MNTYILIYTPNKYVIAKQMLDKYRQIAECRSEASAKEIIDALRSAEFTGKIADIQREVSTRGAKK